MPTTVPTDLSLDALRLLVLVADHGSISAAARVEQISQPSASNRIKQLERRLGLELLDRRSRGAELTEHGRMVTGWARAVVEAAGVLVTGARALAAESEGDVAIAASQTVAEYLVPIWLARFRALDPEARVRLRVANSRDVIAALRGREIDLGFVEGPTVPTDLVRRRVGADRLLLVVAPGHPLTRRRRPVGAEELAELRLASREAGSGTRDALGWALGRELEPGVELDSNAAVKVVVASGAYPAVISELAVAAELRDGRLVSVPVTGVDLTRTLHAIWRRGWRPPAAIEDFLAVVLGRR
ncbi:LysR substrate-binding domain-containing protein [Occultella gossypii]|uniref:LysR family transcriptional regulator n=1 Tax=Occultella gossypii TaxID=2800820 RepID=A0ABS7S9Y3_9MICO|nr:LysR substrate-binding domain-containing protein [Occultella gossypii]MBZ2196723.1 LysR family transcriptional regulator [Occultella gossypii]